MDDLEAVERELLGALRRADVWVSTVPEGGWRFGMRRE
jgi:hypothetical protein